MADHRESRPDGDLDAAESTREFERDETVQLLTDGGEDGSDGTEAESSEDEQGAHSDEAENEGAETENGAEAEEEDQSDETGAEVESADEDTSDAEDDAESSTVESVEGPEDGEEEAEDEEEATSDQDEAEDEGETTSDKDDEEATSDQDEEDPGEQHGIDAEEVYEGEDASGVLHLDLDGLFLDLLGLEVNLNEVTLDVSARPGGNNLLGNLLSSVTGLADGLGSPLEGVKRALGGVKDRLLGLLPGLGGSEDEEAADADEEPTGGILSRIVGAIRRFGSGIVQRLRGIASSIGGWFRRRFENAIMALPIEELIATITRTVIQQIVERAESIEMEDVGMDERGEAEESGQEVGAES